MQESGKEKTFNKMKRLIPVMLLLFYGFGVAFAQQGNERLQAQKVAFITKRLDLTPKEAEGFWAIYNEYQAKRKNVNQKFKLEKSVDNMSDVELENHLTNSFDKEQELLDLKKSYFQKMKKVISIRQIAKLRIAERDFNKSIVDKWKENQQNRRLQRQQLRNN